MLLSLDPNRRKAGWRIPVLKTAALKDQGIVEVVDAMQKHYEYLVESDGIAQRAQRQVRSEVQNLILRTVMNSLRDSVGEDEWNTMIEDVTKRQRDPYSVANELEQRIGLVKHP
jgi:LAO/AO transport system kinase